jgi:hypothetical protein
MAFGLGVKLYRVEQTHPAKIEEEYIEVARGHPSS